jgi:hypothetical protein
MDSGNIGDEIRQDLDSLADLLSPKFFEALAEVAEDDDRWRDAGLDVHAYLSEHDLNVPRSLTIRLGDVFREEPPPCPPGTFHVGEVKSYCIRPVYVCKTAPKVGEVCIFSFCMKWKTEWVSGGCVPIDELTSIRPVAGRNP